MDNDIASKCARYVMERARFVIESFGLRPPGSEAERKAQEVVKAELEGCCDGAVSMEAFPVAQKAFFSMQAVGGVLTLAGALLYWVHPLITLALALIALTVLYHQLLRYHLLLDTFFPKKTSYNVAGRQLPAGPVKRRIILNGHPDAAYEWRFNYLAPKLFPLITFYTLVGLFAVFVVGLVGSGILLFGAPEHQWLLRPVGLAMFLFLPGAVFGIFFNNLKMVAGGANDNLTGTFISTGILKFMREQGEQLQNTELMAVITGSEEAGLRGAKVWARQHLAEYQDVETVVLALDTFRDLPHLTVYSRDLNGTVKHDEAVCRLLKEAGQSIGRDLPFGSIYLGASDGAAFTQAGWRCAALGGMDPHPAHYYHNRRDTWEDMDEECIRVTVEVLLAAIRRYDREGLPA